MVKLDLKTWLRPEDIKSDDVLIFLDEGAMVEIPGKDGELPRKAFEIGVRLPNKDMKTWTMNQKSQIAISSIYGMDTKNWVSHPVKVYKVLQNVFGTEKEVIYARVPQKGTLTPKGVDETEVSNEYVV